MSRRELLEGAASAALGGGALARATELLAEATRAGELRAAVLHVSRGRERFVRAFGAATPETVFLLASITKPMTAAAVMTLVEERRLALDDAVATHLPDFAAAAAGAIPAEARRAVTVRHLLAHTSGLPDMLPDNLELRRRHAPLDDFVAGTCKAPLGFSPGTQVRYQSMGVLLAAAIAERIARTPFRELLRRRLLAPLGMKDTSLGLGGRRLADTAPCQVPDEPWGWNSAYWRELGAPWGGALGTAADLVRLLRFFAHPVRGPLRAESVRLMLTPQTPASELEPSEGSSPPAMGLRRQSRLRPDAASELEPSEGSRPPAMGLRRQSRLRPDAAKERYGLGWRLGPAAKGCSERTFGHSGATGTACWMDPERDLTFVLLTTKPAAEARALLQETADRVSSVYLRARAGRDLR